MFGRPATTGLEGYRYGTMANRRTWYRRFAKLFAAPAYYMYECGQLRSILRARAVDRYGRALPMFTYPAIEFLYAIEPALADADVLEFGCGQSTLWFAPRVRSLLGVEPYEDFRSALQRQFEDDPRIRFIDATMPFDIQGRFDIAVLDGNPRVAAGKFIPTVLRDDGIIIFDNSDFQSLWEVPAHLHELGFARVDFFGYSPTGVRKQGTSIFFKSLKWFRTDALVRPVSANSLTWEEDPRRPVPRADGARLSD